MENPKQYSQTPFISSESQLLDYLEQQGITYQRMEHPAVYTCEEAKKYRPREEVVLRAASTKNLFLCDKKGNRFYLVITDCEKRLNLAGLALSLGESKIRFASENTLMQYLGVTRGAVTMLALVNDEKRSVQLCIDSNIWDSNTFLCHPLVNTATLILSKADLLKFFDFIEHKIKIINM